MPCAARLTEHRAGRDGLPVEPEGHLGQDDGHDAGQVGLDHKVPDLPLEVEVSGHDDVFPCRDSQVGAEPQFASRGQLSIPEIALNTPSRIFCGILVGCPWEGGVQALTAAVPCQVCAPAQPLSHHICPFKTLL